MIYRGLDWTLVESPGQITAAMALMKTLRINYAGNVFYNVDALEPGTDKRHRIRSGWPRSEWLYVVELAAQHRLKSFDEVPLEIHAIEDEVAYAAAKGAYLAAMLVSE